MEESFRTEGAGENGKVPEKGKNERRTEYAEG